MSKKKKCKSSVNIYLLRNDDFIDKSPQDLRDDILQDVYKMDHFNNICGLIRRRW